MISCNNCFQRLPPVRRTSNTSIDLRFGSALCDDCVVDPTKLSVSPYALQPAPPCLKLLSPVDVAAVCFLAFGITDHPAVLDDPNCSLLSSLSSLSSSLLPSSLSSSSSSPLSSSPSSAYIARQEEDLPFACNLPAVRSALYWLRKHNPIFKPSEKQLQRFGSFNSSRSSSTSDDDDANSDDAADQKDPLLEGRLFPHLYPYGTGFYQLPPSPRHRRRHHRPTTKSHHHSQTHRHHRSNRSGSDGSSKDVLSIAGSTRTMAEDVQLKLNSVDSRWREDPVWIFWAYSRAFLPSFTGTTTMMDGYSAASAAAAAAGRSFPLTPSSSASSSITDIAGAWSDRNDFVHVAAPSSPSSSWDGYGSGDETVAQDDNYYHRRSWSSDAGSSDGNGSWESDQYFDYETF